MHRAAADGVEGPAFADEVRQFGDGARPDDWKRKAIEGYGFCRHGGPECLISTSP
jgi:hypothetical protein